MEKSKAISLMLLFSLQCAGIFALISPAAGIERSAASVNTYETYTQEPAPMGIADYGIDPVDNSWYSYNTTSFAGTIAIDSLSVNDGSNDYTATLQLNTILEYAVNSVTYAYWLQDVVLMDTSNNSVLFFDNVWNDSAVNASLYNSTISGNGYASPEGSINFYSSWANTTAAEGNNMVLTYPATIYLQIYSTVNETGDPSVFFSYNDGFGWQDYDQVNFSIPDPQLVDSNLIVDGSQFTPNGYYNDVELILGGGLTTGTTVDTQSDLAMYIDYYDSQTWEPISESYNYGSDTAETISNVVDVNQASSTDDNILTAGAGSLSPDFPSTNPTPPSMGYSLITNVIGIATITITMVIFVALKKGKLRNIS